jgi:competence protein ComEA
MKLWSTTKEKKLVMIIGCLIIVSISFWFASYKKDSNEQVFVSQSEAIAFPQRIENEVDEVNETTEAIEQSKQEEMILIVDVKGAVQHPNVYKLKDGERVIDAIQMAGGLTEGAVTDPINLAQRIVDGMVIYIPTEVEMKEESGTYVEKGFFSSANSIEHSTLTNHTSGKININTATALDLEQLPGIGASRAQAIISYREKKRFTSIDELLSIPGIGPKGFEKLKDLVSY